MSKKEKDLDSEDPKETPVEETEVKEEGEGLEEEQVKALISKNVEEAIEKMVDETSKSIVDKFIAGVDNARAKISEKSMPAGDQSAEQKVRKWAKALFAGDIATCKALTTSSSGSSPDDAAAGLLIPTELMAEVMRIAETQYGIARRDMRYLPFSGPGNTRTIPALGTSVSVTWTNEAVAKTSTQPTFSTVTQTLKKLAAIVPFTEEIIEDSAIQLIPLLAELFAEAMAKEIDIQFFRGTGSPWTGILNNGSVNKVVQASGDATQLTADDLLDMIDETPTGSLDGAKFYMHRTVLSVIRKLKDDQGQYIYQNPGQGLPATIWNYPVETSDAFPTLSTVATGNQYILFGNLRQACVYGDKQQMRVKLLTEASITDTDGSTSINLAEQDMQALRVVQRVGYVVALPTALTVLEAQATVS